MLRNPNKTKDELVAWIRNYMNESGGEALQRKAVLGLSGGKDSTIAAALCVEAIGKERVVAMLLPNRTQYDLGDAIKVANYLGIDSYLANIGDIVTAIERILSGSTPRPVGLNENTKINIPPRVRMLMLYAMAQEIGHARVVNTSNRSERHIGWSTKFGDGAGDFAPLADLLSHEVVQIGKTLLLPTELVEKKPADGLTGRSDEEVWGFSYAQLDHYIVTKQYDGNKFLRDMVDAKHYSSRHKYEPMPMFLLREHDVE